MVGLHTLAVRQLVGIFNVFILLTRDFLWYKEDTLLCACCRTSVLSQQ